MVSLADRGCPVEVTVGGLTFSGAMVHGEDAPPHGYTSYKYETYNDSGFKQADRQTYILLLHLLMEEHL